MKLLFMGDGNWGRLCLQKLIEKNKDIAGVVIRKNPTEENLEKIAIENNLPIYQPDNVNSQIFHKDISNINPELIISVSYDQILKKQFIDIPEKGVINLHAGMLPYYRGRSPINWALINDEDYIGLTVHYIDEGIDTGDIILQEKIPITKDDNYKTLQKKTEEIAPTILLQAILLIDNELVIPKKHSQKEGIYLPKRKEGDEIINWHWSSKRIHNFIRALVPPGPGARTYVNGNEIKILESSLVDTKDFIGNPGQIVGKNEKGIKVKTGDNLIFIEKIQINENIKTPDFKIGTRLGKTYQKNIIEMQKRIKKLENEIKNIRDDLNG